MPGDLRAHMRLTADAKGFVGEVRVAGDQVERLSRAMGRGEAPARSYARATAEVEQATSRARRSFLSAHSAVLRYVTGIASVGGFVAATRGTIRYADAYTQVTNAVRLATRTGADLAQVQEELFGIAHRTRAPVADVAALYQKLSLAAGDLGASQDDLLAVIEGVGQSLVISGTSASAASGAMLQLSQALAGGVVRAEEFNSVVEGAPALLQAVIRHFGGVGVSLREMRRRLNAGQVSSRDFFDALQAALPDLDRDFGRAASTIGQSLTQVDSAMTQLIGRAGEVTGIPATLAGAFGGLADAIRDVEADDLAGAIDALGAVALAATGAVGGRLVSALGAAGLALVAAEGRSRAAATGLRVLGRAAGVASRSLALLGGPAGLLWAVGGALAAFGLSALSARDDARALGDDLDGQIETYDEIIERVRALTRAQRDRLIVTREAEIADLEAAHAEIAAQILSHELASVGGVGSIDPADDDRFLEGLKIRQEGILQDIARARERLERERAAIEGAPDPSPAPGATPPGATTLDPGAARDAEANARAVEVVTRRSEDRRARLTLDRIGLVRRAERQAIEELRALHGQPGVEEERLATAFAAVRAGAAAEIQRIRQEQHDAEVAAEQAALDAEREAHERRRALLRSASREIARALASPYEQARLDIGEWYETQHAALVAAGAREEDFLRLAAARALAIQRATHDARLDEIRRAREQELLELEGYRDREQADEEAHERRKNAIRYRGAEEVGRVADILVGIENRSAVGRAKALLDAGQQIGSIHGAQSRKLFRLQQVAGIAQAAIATAAGVAEELKKGYPLGYVTGALIAAAGAAQIAAIRAQRPPQAFARGGIVDSPTFFSARNVPRGVAGEAGPEAILPLARGPDGRLGVEARTAAAPSLRVTIAPTIHVTVTADPDRRPDETGAVVARRVRDELIPVIRATLADELRPGGLLRPTDRAA